MSIKVAVILAAEYGRLKDEIFTWLRPAECVSI